MGVNNRCRSNHLEEKFVYRTGEAGVGDEEEEEREV